MCFQEERKSCKQQVTQKTTFTQAFFTEVKTGSSIHPRLRRDGPSLGQLVELPRPEREGKYEFHQSRDVNACKFRFSEMGRT